ncbi:MAG: MFS transporter [Anaerolineaceae bacterium]|nr:MFS transporter [Anaerolineaceae bacterium]
MELKEFDAEIERHARFNMIVNALDGVFFWTGMGFIAPTIILPLYISHFTNNSFLIGLIPFISSSCYLLPQLFTSNWTSRQPRKKFLPVNIGFFTERIPIFLMPFSVLLFAKSAPGLALVSFFLLYAWHATGAGVIMVGWQDMVGRVIPMDRRGRFFGITNFGGTLGGILAASLVTWLLARFVFPVGYTLAFGAAAIMIFFSWLSLAQTREPALASSQPHVTLGQYLRSLPAVIQRDHNFRRLLIAQVVLGLSAMGVGFVIVFAVRRWNLPDSQAGNYTMALLAGQALANLWIGPLSDRVGHKLVMELTALFSLASYIMAWLAPSRVWFYPVFALRGASMAAGMLSGMLIALEFSEPDQRATYIGLNSTVSGIANAVAPLVGGWLALVASYQSLFAIAAVVSLAAFAMLRWTVTEPRHSQPAIPPLPERD